MKTPAPEKAFRLIGAVRDLSGARSVQDVMDVVRLAARELAESDGVTFVLRDGDRCFYAEENAIAPLWKGKRFPAESCISGWAMIHRETVAIPDIYADRRIPHDAYRPTFVKSLAMVPVRRSEPVAAIGVYWAREHQASHEEIDLVELLADTAAVALANVDLYQQLGHAKTAAEQKAAEIERLYTALQRETDHHRKTELQLHHAQRMDAMGRLAGGVAHDFNNLLTGILGYSNLLLAQTGLDAAVRRDVEEIRATGERAAELTRQLLAFSRRQVLQPRVVSLNSLISDFERTLRRIIGEDIEVRLVLTPDAWPAKVDAGQIDQVLLNLVVNARDAMPRGGRLTIETANVELDAAYAREHLGSIPGPHVMLSVTDTGTGMDRETQARLFEPFFTTKEKGKGTGLGLSTVHGIVKQSGGSIWVYSEPGRGTTFKIYFPRSDGSAQAPQRTEPGVVAARGSETVLLVEDNEGLRALACRILEASGYRVLAAERAPDALDLSRRHAGPIHLLITDVVLPGMSGPELAGEWSKERPEGRVLFVSGYTHDAVLDRGMVRPDRAFLQKPFTPRGLAGKVREVLDAPRA